MPNILRVKCAVVGDSTVGKTALMQMLLSEGRQFPKSYTMTLGADLFVKQIPIPDTDDVVELYLYDSSGLEIYEDLLPKYWNEPKMMMVLYDVTSESSFQAASQWTTLVRSFIPKKFADVAPGILFANKVDLVERRTVNEQMGTETAEKFGLHYLEGSAKQNLGVKEPFSLLAQEWFGIVHRTPRNFGVS
ncbi:intraflagellar transport protein 27 homolog [Schistocerca serialis cubense]|uniref:intraflagellar transport protein 27 homolog n=1 Tax=Schistocerca serialis cubense TaxID=2023355 RepID=UPI00214E5524|nr:intraflagellar transport protein 27 homolog [Schistocerca serialis cubense]